MNKLNGRIAAAGFLLWTSGCEPAPGDAGPGRTDSSAAAQPPGPVMASGVHSFDAGAIAVGDTILGLRVISREVSRVLEDSVWSGTVGFEGEVEVTGVYQPHFDYPEPPAVCFHLDSISSLKIPEFAPDAWSSANGKPWFCFSNQEKAVELLGPAETPRPATIVIDRYKQTRYFTDAVDDALLVRVVRKGAAREAGTLREPFRFAR